MLALFACLSTKVDAQVIGCDIPTQNLKYSSNPEDLHPGSTFSVFVNKGAFASQWQQVLDAGGEIDSIILCSFSAAFNAQFCQRFPVTQTAEGVSAQVSVDDRGAPRNIGIRVILKGKRSSNSSLEDLCQKNDALYIRDVPSRCIAETEGRCDVCVAPARCTMTIRPGPISGEGVFACVVDQNNLCQGEDGAQQQVVFSLCQQAGAEGSEGRKTCEDCAKKKGIWTAVGCIPFSDTAELVRAFITLGLGIAGTVVVLMTLAGAFLMSTSKGEPQKVDEAKSLITSAIAGIFFLIFSVSILQFIGVRILQLPGFG